MPAAPTGNLRTANVVQAGERSRVVLNLQRAATYQAEIQGRSLLVSLQSTTGQPTKTPGVVRNGTWYLRNSNSAGPADISLVFGDAGDTPVAGDWDGDGTDGIGLYDPATSTFSLTSSLNGGGPDLQFQFGPRNHGGLPVIGDWNGDVWAFDADNGKILWRRHLGGASLVACRLVASSSYVTGIGNGAAK